ncbi:MAG: hypothetical protein K2P51_07520 [Rhabdochlamydiaceae bacterium]|nr:hypothetical protein [Rhabdochlamydiaceae bacterium]
MTPTSGPSWSALLFRNATFAACNAGLGGIAAAVFTQLNPVTGAVFCGTSSLALKLIQSVIGHGNSEQSRIIYYGQLALSIISGIGAGVLMTTLIGFPLSFEAGITLTVSMLATSTVIMFCVVPLIFKY